MDGVAATESVDTLSSPQRSTKRATVLGIFAALAGLLFGLDTGVVSGALPFVAKEFHASDVLQGWIVSSMMIGAMTGSLVAGRISTRFGRTGAMVSAAVLYVSGVLICTFAPDPYVLMGGRVLIGLAIGLGAFAAPLYISEITVESARGSMISVYQLMVSFGIFLGFLSDSVLAGSGRWHWMFGAMLIPSVLFLIFTLTLPHSPRWLLMQGKQDHARRVLRVLRSDDEVAEAELRDIQSGMVHNSDSGLGLFRSNANFRRTVFLGMLLQIMQQLTGINALLYYAPRVFEAAHFGANAAVWVTTLVGLVNMALTGVAIACVDKWGRRPLLLLSCSLAMIAMLGVGVLLLTGASSFPAQMALCGFVLLFVAGFAIGEGPLVWTLCSEFQPSRGRDFGIGCSTVTNWAANWVISSTFPLIMAGLGTSWTFIMFAGFNALFAVITMTLVPETKGVALETLEKNLFAGKSLRNIGQ
ncbi:sugar porter family MFS transporter [Neokomagataea anthophila]|uniref:Sugar porter family MFS transporter n=1 Tax=Neokomagataea anthophila TaxID=2826925 RepID=A0ABS5E687_9PROT|nr:sugar porter family MFS transporter [Neokomagataea anthophila]MBR0559423.1 sugar porter family MFS transporter [Neokomagataea anthophila]